MGLGLSDSLLHFFDFLAPWRLLAGKPDLSESLIWNELAGFIHDFFQDAPLIGGSQRVESYSQVSDHFLHGFMAFFAETVKVTVWIFPGFVAFFVIRMMDVEGVIL